MDDILVVNFAALHSASDHVAGAVMMLNEQLSQLERDAAPLVSTWDGDARTAYDARQKQWQSAASELSAMLADIKKALDESAQDYRNTEDRNKQLFV
jgi:WXG100 family type VII secretion target